jgi:hypothetical protein
MGRQREGVGVLRIALDSISHRWAGWGLTVHAALTLGGTKWAIQQAITGGEHETAYALYVAVGIGLIKAFGISTATVVTAAEVTDAIMVIAHFVGQRMKAEGIAEGREQGRMEGRAEVKAQVNEKINQLVEAHPELREELEALLIREDKADDG